MAIVKVPDCSIGFYPDLMPEELKSGAWSGVTNMRFRVGFAERFRGMANIFGTPSAAPYYITPYTTATTRYWVTGCLAKIYAYDGTAEHDITPTVAPTGAIDDRYTGGMFNGVLILNNGKDVPWAWGGATASPAATLSAWDANWRCKSMRPFKNFLVALNITKTATIYPHMVKWSNAAVPGAVPTSWNEANPANDAGEVDLAETSDVIVDALPMGDQLIIYKERSMYSMRYVGGQSIMAFQRLPGETGMLARGCAVDTPVGHVVLTAGDVVVHQGGNATSIADGVVRRFIFNNMNSFQAQRSFVCLNPQKHEVLVCFPTVDSETCDTAAVWNWDTKAWGVRTLSNVTYGASGQINSSSTLLQWDADSDSWESDASTWNENEYAANESRLLLARTTKVTAFDVGTADFGAEIDSSLEVTGMSLGDPYANKLIRAVYPRIDAPTGTVVNVTIGGAMNATDAPVWGSPVPFVVGSQIKADCFASGRFLALRFEGEGFEPWRIRSYDLDVVSSGAY
jgi:hypothetical protein